MTRAQAAHRRQAWRRVARLGPRAAFDATVGVGAAVCLAAPPALESSPTLEGAWPLAYVVLGLWLAGSILVVLGTVRRDPVVRAVGSAVMGAGFALALVAALDVGTANVTMSSVLAGAAASHAITAVAAWRIAALGLEHDPEAGDL